MQAFDATRAPRISSPPWCAEAWQALFWMRGARTDQITATGKSQSLGTTPPRIPLISGGEVGTGPTK